MTLSEFEGHFSTVVPLCAQLTRDLLGIAKFLVFWKKNRRTREFNKVLYNNMSIRTKSAYGQIYVRKLAVE